MDSKERQTTKTKEGKSEWEQSGRRKKGRNREMRKKGRGHKKRRLRKDGR